MIASTDRRPNDELQLVGRGRKRKRRRRAPPVSTPAALVIPVMAVLGCENVDVTLLDTLVVEDSVEYTQVVVAVLRSSGHRVRTATTVADAQASMASVPPDLVILDLTLPDGDGLDLCQEIRERSDAYVIMLTGRDEEVDKLIGFRLGADDYITKPFSPRELGARVDALARRPRTTGATDADERVFDELVVRPTSREVVVGGSHVELTRIEFDLLDQFTANPKRVFTRAQLLGAVWGDDWFGDDHVVDVHIANLRKKLAAHTDRAILRTVRGVGYGLAS